ncbi:hypothetical protein F5B20DRAFT_593540 [Whalleya microplaca]|nr:hypothetical protein F5B20DRAFT_593540 [Whalleya microplaca]
MNSDHRPTQRLEPPQQSRRQSPFNRFSIAHLSQKRHQQSLPSIPPFRPKNTAKIRKTRVVCSHPSRAIEPSDPSLELPESTPTQCCTRAEWSLTKQTAHTVSQRLRKLRQIPAELIPLGVVVGFALFAAGYSSYRKFAVDKNLRLQRQNRKDKDEAEAAAGAEHH